jgi:heme b synthase
MKHGHPHGHTPRLVFWELTKRCNLRCAHCRAEAEDRLYEEMSTGEIITVIDAIAAHYRPIMVLTGGEPLYREDLFEIAAHAKAKGLVIALATNGTLIDAVVAGRIRGAGFDRVSISIDGADAASHDGFRGISGSFARALRGAAFLREVDVPFQFNMTITKRNVGQLAGVLALAEERGAKALHVFVLVPVGCGVEIAGSDMLSPLECEQALEWLCERSRETEIEFKATCAPQYYRIIRQKAKAEGKTLTFESDGLAAVTRGCLAGTGVCFISNRGDVQPCGYLPVVAGNVRRTPFHEIWENAPVFRDLRNYDALGGKCGLCGYRSFCGGCRARAWHETGDYMAEEPSCLYEPPALRGRGTHGDG